MVLYPPEGGYLIADFETRPLLGSVIPTLSAVDGWEWPDEQCLFLVTWGVWIKSDSPKVNGGLYSDPCVKFYEVIIFFFGLDH